MSLTERVNDRLKELKSHQKGLESGVGFLQRIPSFFRTPDERYSLKFMTQLGQQNATRIDELKSLLKKK